MSFAATNPNVIAGPIVPPAHLLEPALGAEIAEVDRDRVVRRVVDGTQAWVGLHIRVAEHLIVRVAAASELWIDTGLRVAIHVCIRLLQASTGT